MSSNIQAGILAVRNAAIPAPNHIETAATALHTPGHTIFVADQQRLSVLSITIDATTSITTSRAVEAGQTQQPFPQQKAQPSPTLHPPSRESYRHASTSKLRSPQPPPSSFFNSSPKPSRTRPLSHDFGQKAKDAFSEFGRLANRRTSAMERANGADTLARVADSINGSSSPSKHARRVSLQPGQLQQPQQQRVVGHDKTSQLHLASDDAVVARSQVTRSFSLLPQRDARLASQTIPFGVRSCTSIAGEASPTSSAVEFTTAPAKTTSNGDGGISAIPTFDPSRLLLKVQPPAELARDSWSRSASFLTAHNASQYQTLEESAVHFRFRLRLGRSSTTPTSSSFPRTDRNAAASPLVEQDQGLGQVLFLSAESPDKLVEAIESPESSIATPELAALEGISRVPVTPSNNPTSSAVTRGPTDCDFNWTWKSLSRSNVGNGSRCCCAFVEMRPDGKSATLLATMSVYIQLPSPAPTNGSFLSSAKGATSASNGLSRSDSLALIAALNLDHDDSPRFGTEPLSTTTRVGPQSNHHSSSDDQPQLPQSQDTGPLLIDRTELTLDDLASDSPIFRAAVANLERRTASMKKSSKAVLRAAQEARARTLKLIEAQEGMDSAFDGLIGFAPETLGRLQDQFLRQARTKITQHRREQANIIESCLERPLNQIIELCRVAQEGFKVFENESKSYYSQTQKWLANRSNGDAPSVPNEFSSATASERVQKQRSADEKQKLRELRFEQARTDLFVVLQRLHGGRAEAHLTQSVLKLSQWLVDLPTTLDWSDKEHKSCLTTLDASLRTTLDDQAAKLQEVEARSRRLGDRIRSLEQALGKTADTDSELIGQHRSDLEQEQVQQAPANGAASSKARKFKSFLGAFAAGINNSPLISSKSASPNPESVETQKQPELVRVASEEQSQKPNAVRRLSLKLKNERGQQVGMSASSPSKSQAPSSWRYDNLPATPRRATESQERDGEASGLQAPAKASRDLSDGGSSVDSGFESSTAPIAEQGLGIFEPAPSTASQIVGRGEASGAPSSWAAKPVTPGGDRKKEGVLWVSTKPIVGPAGADAPRGINRSTHWRECWVVLSGSGQISEFADWKNAKALEPTNPLIDLRFATVREARGVDRRFAFEIVTRDNRRLFQAPDEEAMRDWMRAISKAIESLLNGTSSVRKIDRVVGATPFRNLDSVRRAGALDEHREEPGAGEGNDFAVRRLLDRTSKAFSQSMTDLSSSAKAQSGDRKAQAKIGGHLAALSESQAGSSTRSSRRASQHERGISNKTPLSGYLGTGGLGLSAVDKAALHRRDGTEVSDDGSISSTSVNGEQDAEFDRQIEAVIHRSYGSHDDTQTSHSGFSHRSAPGGVDEMGKLKGNGASANGRSSTSPSKRNGAAKASVTSTAASTKMSRSAEVAAISRQPENRRCADCRESDPRWASWMLANEPCCIFICIGCSGVHRSLGVHISKVKSVDLDDWTEEQLQSARDWGNARANALWEYSKPAGTLPSAGDRKKFWRRKYVEAAWKNPNAPLVREEAAASAQSDRSPVQGVAVDDVDATPTRRFAPIADQTPKGVASPEKKSQSHAQALGLRITSGDQASRSNGKAGFSDVLGSPKPNGPRPLPERRSVSMQATAVSSPPLSPHAAANRGLPSPISTDPHDQPDWTVYQDISPLRSSDSVEPTATFAHPRQGPSRAMSISVSASLPYISTLSPIDPYVSDAMLAARADPRLFPSEESRLQVASPPSSFFVSNLNGRMPSPMFGGESRGGPGGWAGESDAEKDAREGEGSPVGNPPARFEAFTADAR